MGSLDKLILKILSGVSDANIGFDELCNILINLGFDLRIKGRHHVFRKNGVEEKVNLQKDGANAKPYQVRQVRNILVKYKLIGK